MRIVEIVAQENGAHRNQNGGLTFVPFGWAKIPEDMETPNFPFGEVEVEEINGVMTVTKWTAGVVPSPDPDPDNPDPGEDTSVWDELDKAYLEGVNSAYDQ